MGDGRLRDALVAELRRVGETLAVSCFDVA